MKMNYSIKHTLEIKFSATSPPPPLPHCVISRLNSIFTQRVNLSFDKKEILKIGKLAKYQREYYLTRERKYSSAELQKFVDVCMVVSLCQPTIQTTVKFYDVDSFLR